MTPDAAAAENRFMIAAVAGMAMLRKTIISRRNERATTMPTKSGSLVDSWLAKSSASAVWPPTSTSRLLPCTVAGMTLSRSRVIRAEVEASCGEPAGYTSATAMAGWPGPAGSTSGPAVVTTPDVCAAALTTRANSASSAGPLTVATSCSGPLKPGPNPWTSIS